ncbi:hypothetical protein, partial [uncultured Thiodictyon sp.]|uniref:hypothetical protein n=1 Tax=uncultured Thiodictyon sp. TaxID=1846217 RepID=UPI0025EFC80D
MSRCPCVHSGVTIWSALRGLLQPYVTRERPDLLPRRSLTAIELSRNGYWERRTPVRRGLCSTPTRRGYLRDRA